MTITRERNNNDRLARWLEDTVRQQYAGEVALVCLYGSYINGTADARSDLDCYFMPKTPKGETLARTFLLDGVGYDIFPMEWQRLEAIARLELSHQPLVGDVQILYADSADDLGRLEKVQQLLRRNLADEAYRAQIARQRLGRARAIQPTGTEDLRLCRLQAGGLLMDVAEALAFREGAYFHRGLKTQFADLQALKTLPEDFTEHYLSVLRARTAGEIAAACRRLLEKVGFEAPMPPRVWDAPTLEGPALARLYEELVSSFLKIYRCGDKKDPVLAFLSAVCLQWQLPWVDLLTAYDFDDLGPLVRQARQVEAQVRDTVERTGGQLRCYDTFEDFVIHWK